MPCDCEACKLEVVPAGTKFECPGHGCTEKQTAQEYLKALVMGAERVHGVEGSFDVDYHSTPRDNDYFDLKRDNTCGYEIATPPVEGRHVMKAFGPLLSKLEEAAKEHGIEFVDKRCGLHCTFDVQDVGVRGVKQILFTALRHQAALVGTQPAYRKNNDTCKFVQGGMALKKAIAREKELSPKGTKANIPPLKDKHYFANFMKVKDRGLIEFRFGGATTDPAKVEAFGVLLECLIDASLRRPAICITNNRKRRLYEEIIKPYEGDERVRKAWKGVLEPELEKAELARV